MVMPHGMAAFMAMIQAAQTQIDPMPAFLIMIISFQFIPSFCCFDKKDIMNGIIVSLLSQLLILSRNQCAKNQLKKNLLVFIGLLRLLGNFLEVVQMGSAKSVGGKQWAPSAYTFRGCLNTRQSCLTDILCTQNRVIGVPLFVRSESQIPILGVWNMFFRTSKRLPIRRLFEPNSSSLPSGKGAWSPIFFF